MFRKSLAAVALLGAFSAPVAAADLYIPEVVIEPELFTWTTCYVGAKVKYTVGEVSSVFPYSDYRTNVTGPGLSPQLGCDWQLPDSPVVLGVVVDATLQNVTGSNDIPGRVPTQTLTSTIPWDLSLRARAGVAADKTLFYLTGGLAVASINNSLVVGANPAINVSATHIGWTVGGGIETMVTDNVSIFAEYRYTDLGSQNYTFPGADFGGGVDTIPLGSTSHSIAVGANYRF